MEIRLGIPGSGSGQVDFDNVRLTSEPAGPAAPCTPAAAGLVGWWRAEGDRKDVQGNGDGAPASGMTFVPGVVGQAFSFAGNDLGVLVGNPAAFQVQELTLESWVRRADPTSASQGGFGGAIFAGGEGSYGFAIESTGEIAFSKVGVSKVHSTGRVTDTQWHHVAVTKTGGDVRFYIDGAAAGAADYQPLFTFTSPFAIGSIGATFGQNNTFLGLIDEPSLYTRALDATEIAAIHNARSAGKCVAPVENITVTASGPATARYGTDFTVNFSVVNQGAQPASNVVVSASLPTGFTLTSNTASQGTIAVSSASLQGAIGTLPGGATATVTLTGHADAAATLIFHGVVTRDGTDLTTTDNQADASIHIFGPALAAPTGLVGWWRAEDDTKDALGNGDGTPSSSMGFAPGFVGHAFSFSGRAPGVSVGNPLAFQLQNFSIEAWIKRADNNSLSQDNPYGGDIFAGGYGSYGLAMGQTGELIAGQIGVSSVSSSGKVADTQWHHVAVTKNGQSVKFYIDGQPAGTASYNPTFTFGTPFAIGSLGATFDYNYTFWGLIDETSLYNRALSGSEIGAIYDANMAGKSAENMALNASAPAAVQPGTDFTASFSILNQGAQPATGVVLNTTLPAGFSLVTNTTSQGTNIIGAASVQSLLDTLAPGATATVTLTGHGSSPANLVFHGLVTRDGADLTPTDNQLDVSVEVLGPCVTAPGGLVAWLRGEGDPSDELSHASTFTNIKYAPGKVGQALLFDGASEVVINDSPDFDQSSFTLEAWVYPTTVDGTVDIIANKETSYPNLASDIQFEIGIKGPLSDAANNIPQGNLAFFISGISGLPNNYGGWTDAKAAIPLNQWTHIALTVAPGTVTAYVNGSVTIKKTGLTGSPVFNNWPLKIGSRSTIYVTQTRPQDRFNGRIDEFSFYGRALTDAEIAAVYQAGGAGKCVQPVAPTIVVGPKDQTVLAGQDATFGVVAAGTGPLQYQWQFKGTDIADATNSTVLVAAPRKAAAGAYSVTVCNVAGCTPAASASLTVTPAPALISLVSITNKSPQDVIMPLRLIGNGVENALSFSLRFDTNRLTFLDAELGADAAEGQILVNSAQATRGILGIILALPAGAAFAEGTNDVLQLTFGTALVTANTVVPVTFSDTPILKKISDASSKVLTGTWSAGSVAIIAADFEGDVSPLPEGDKQVELLDFVQMGRFVAGLDDIAPGALFQRADCAPLVTSGNGRLTVSDWVQSGRFAAGLDPLNPVGGPTAPEPVKPGRKHPVPLSPDPRVVSFGSTALVAGQTREIPVTLLASGEENALAFSVSYDPAGLRFVGAVKGSGSKTATLNVNIRGTASGKVGLALALTSGAKFPAGTLEIARLQFAAITSSATSTNLSFIDAPVVREVASPLAETLPVAWLDAAFSVTVPAVNARPVATPNGPGIELSWSTSITGATLEATEQLAPPAWSPVNLTPFVRNEQNILVLPLHTATAYFRLQLP